MRDETEHKGDNEAVGVGARRLRDAEHADVRDTLGRPLRDLRISVTDRCNFRCVYCMPKEVFGRDYRFLERRELLTFEEIERLARAFVAHGVEKIRITGGEPLVRRDLERLIAQLAAIDGLDLTLTTNGSLLPQKAQALRDAGLGRVTVSLDSLDDEVFTRDERRRLPGGAGARRDRRRRGRRAAGEGEHGRQARRRTRTASLPMAAPLPRHAATSSASSSTWTSATRTAGGSTTSSPPREIVAAIDAELPLEPAEPNYRGEVARRWRYRDGGGEIGVIASVTQPFCGDCTRARLSAEGRLYTCLFGVRGHDLRALVRGGVSDDELREEIGRIWAPAHRPLFGDPVGEHGRAAQGGDVVYRRVGNE